MNLAAVLDNLKRFRGVEWSLDGNTLAGLTIHTPDITPPTQQEVDAAWQTLQPLLAADLSARREKELTRIARLDAIKAAAGASSSVPALRAQVELLTDIVLELASR